MSSETYVIGPDPVARELLLSAYTKLRGLAVEYTLPETWPAILAEWITQVRKNSSKHGLSLEEYKELFTRYPEFPVCFVMIRSQNILS